MRVLILLAIINCLSAFAKPTFKVGVVYPSINSGKNSIGKEAFCISKGVLDTNKDKSFDIEYEFIEVQHNAVEIVSKIKKMKNVDILVGSVSSSQALAILKVLDKNVPLIVPTASHTNVTSAKNPNVISVSNTDPEMAKQFGKYVISEVKPKKLISVLNISKINQVEFNKRVLEQLGKQTQVKIKKIVNGFNEYQKLIDEIMIEKPDTILLAINSIQAIKIYNELSRRNFKGVLLGGGSIGGRADFLNALTKDTKKLPLTFIKVDYDAVKDNNANKYSALHEKFCNGERHTMVTVSAFDAISVALELMKNSVENKTSMISEVGKLEYKGLTGNLEMGDRNFKRPLYLYQIKGRNTKFWKKVNL